MVCPEVYSHVTRKIEAFIEEDTRYKKHCTQNNDTSVSFTVGTMRPHTVLPVPLLLVKTWQNPLLESPSAAPWYFPESHWLSEISSFSKVILVLGKARSHRAPNLGCRRLSHLGDFMLPQKYSAWDVMNEWVHFIHDEAANHQLPIAAGLLNHLNRFHREMFKLDAKSDADSFLYSLSFWMWQPHSTHAHSMASTAPTD